MKHNLQIIIILLSMFFITQLIGLAVINAYSPKTKLVFNKTTGQYDNITIQPKLPYGMQPPEEIKPGQAFTSIVIAMLIAVFLIFLLMRIKATLLLRLWFFFVVVIALSITFNTVILKFNYSEFIALIIALPLAFYKVFKRNLIVHNLTELLIYPGIAAVFVPILNLWAIVLLLLLISVYDIYAVWHTGHMQKMVKFQINKVKAIGGFLLPIITKKQKLELKKLRAQAKKSRKGKKKGIRVGLAILGGGDVVFPIIFAGIVFKTLGFIPAITISIFATLSILYIFMIAKKKEAYPAMPFITAGCLIGLTLSYLLS
jgi:presenilin-like A22 family membrane protease